MNYVIIHLGGFDMFDFIKGKNCELKKELNEILTQISSIEEQKKKIVDIYEEEKKTGCVSVFSSLYTEEFLKQGREYLKNAGDCQDERLLELDKMSFELSLEYNRLLLEDKDLLGDFNSNNLVDATEKWATEFLSNHGLIYPLSGCSSMKEVNDNYNSFLAVFGRLQVSDFDKRRIIGIADYCHQKELLLLSHWHVNIM